MTVLTAANAFRTSPTFQRTSLRHLADLVENARSSVMTIRIGDPKPVDGVFVLVLSGYGLAASVLPIKPGMMLWTGWARMVDALAGITSGGPLTAGHPGTALTFTLDNQPMPLESTAEDLVVLNLNGEVLRKAATASPSFAMSVDVGRVLLPIRPTYTLFDVMLGR